MDRRGFLKTIGAGLSLSAVGWGFDKDSKVKKEVNRPDMVAVRNGEPVQMYKRAIKEMGGIEKYVSEGQTVLIKPNIGWARTPDTGADTNPDLVAEVVKECLDAGAKKVYVFDHTCNNWKECYDLSGIKTKASEAGAEVVPGNSESYFSEVEIPQAKILKKTKVHDILLDSDVFINIPVIKHHGSTKLTNAMKNMMGVVWDRGYYHRNGLHRCITDFCYFRKPDLNIADGYRVTLDNGPQRARPEDIEDKKMLLMSEDIVAIDAAAAQIIGIKPEAVEHIQYGYEANLGEMDLNKVNIKKIAV